MSDILLMENVACARGGRLLFERLDLRLQPGEAICVRGPNGSGKSSLLRLAAGLLRAAEGTVRTAGAALADEGLALDREQTLREALRFWAGLDGAGARLDQALAALELEHLGDLPVRMLSAGQARRAQLARVLASGAPLWLLDEPLNGLDSGSVGRLEQLLADHRSAGGAVLAASHLAMPGDCWRTLELGT